MIHGIFIDDSETPERCRYCLYIHDCYCEQLQQTITQENQNLIKCPLDK